MVVLYIAVCIMCSTCITSLFVCTLPILVFIELKHVVVSCVCVCVCVCVSVRSFLPPRASISRNIGTYVFTATRKKTFIIVR